MMCVCISIRNSDFPSLRSWVGALLAPVQQSQCAIAAIICRLCCPLVLSTGCSDWRIADLAHNLVAVAKSADDFGLTYLVLSLRSVLLKTGWDRLV